MVFSRFSSFLLLFIFFCLSNTTTFSQSVISGIVFDLETGETIIGARVTISGTSNGTITEVDGTFSLAAEDTFQLPLTLEVSMLGFATSEVLIDNADSSWHIFLSPSEIIGEEIIIAASRIEERILEAPVSIERMGILDIRYTPSADFFYHLGNFKGIQLNASSIGFQAINTRGFGDAVPLRFVSFVDGMDLVLPTINGTVGNLAGPSELDVLSVEVVPGPGTALYGPNVFNGAMLMSSKDPFEFQGLSAYFKQGVAHQNGLGNRPYIDTGVRFAKAINEKLAIKLNVSYVDAIDWASRDESYHITLLNRDNREELIDLARNSPAYDAIHVYGDEIHYPVSLGSGQAATLSRTGIPESDLVNPQINNIKLQWAAHYKITDKVSAQYDFRLARFDATIRQAAFIHIDDGQQLAHKIEINAPGFFARAYASGEKIVDAFSLEDAATYIQEKLKSTQVWLNQYQDAYNGKIPGVNAEVHDEARLFADRDIPGPNSVAFQQALQETLSNPDPFTGGSQFPSTSSFVHAESGYDFKNLISIMELQVGGSARRYSLQSNGSTFNDGSLGLSGPIKILEYGVFAQIGKKFIDDQLNVRASLRYDGHSNFQGRFSPRISAVLTQGRSRQHNIRMSWQKGFRNPSPQRQYYALDAGSVVLLGNTFDNINNYQYFLPNLTTVSGTEIYNNLVTLSSYREYLASENPETLEKMDLDFLKQEEITTIEIGYRGLAMPGLYADAYLYMNQYNNFIALVNGYSQQVDRIFSIGLNIAEPVTSLGFGAGLDYRSPKGLDLNANYTYSNFNASLAIAENQDYQPGFNTPKNRLNLIVGNRNLYKGLGFHVAFRYSQGFYWFSPQGEGDIDSYQIVDAAISYKVPQIHCIFKMGANNLLNTPYLSVYGGPGIGSLYFFSVSFDQNMK